MAKKVTFAAVRAALVGTAELALLDVREQGVHYRGHPFFACSAPLSRLELMIRDLVPRAAAPVVVLDAGGDGLAEKATERLASMGYSDVSVLDGGCAGWQAAGGELFSGVNVPSKAFGEFVEHRYDTPRISANQLHEWVAHGKRLVILDSRPFEEYRRMNIPGGIDVPGAELAWRVHDVAPDPDTLVVVNCAGRTRSIIGCQSLRNAGIPNRVVALKDGTMGWDLAGFECERGAARVAPPPSDQGKAKALAAAERVAARFHVKYTQPDEVNRWRADAGRTLYMLDVRTREEFERGHVAGSRHAAGGQLVQASDEYVAVRNARVVLIDPERVRAVMTASWLEQMGWNEVYVLDDLTGLAMASGPRTPPEVARWPIVCSPDQVDGTVLDLSTSLRFYHAHVPGGWWVVRSRLSEAKEKIGEVRDLILTSEDGLLAHLAAPEAAALWPQARVSVLEGGNAAWIAAGKPTESGVERATTTRDDVWYKPYDHASDYKQHARDYLAWEVALVDQVKRDPTIRFRSY
ncbi:MAG TPA: rhodanese-like domain-containing protein [Burkholderiales bacterium]|nr:rhodanese-like domain-containing protein [Burkholderiales bacterium]